MYTIEDVDTDVLDYIKSLTLLCVEDNITSQLIYQTIFEDLVEQTIYCDNGREGFEKFLNNKVDIIVTDYSMPEMNGIDMIKKIRNLNSTIPIILVSNIEDIEVMAEAIELEINSFIRKPIVASNITNAITKTTKILIADRYLQEQRDKKIAELEEKDKYNSYQEDLAFAKELNILKNDFYYQMLNMQFPAMLDFMYKPLDVVSGDAYSARILNDEKTFYLVVDGMGKGLSASLSAMIITSFINYTIDTLKYHDLQQIVGSSLEYIKPVLLEDEALSIDYIILDSNKEEMQYAKFSMPSALIQTDKDEVIKIKSNNPPMSKYTRDFKVSSFDISECKKFLFYSDGMVENNTRFDGRAYEDFISDDFLESFTKEDLREKLLWKIDTQEDDMTFIFINKLNMDENIISTKEFQSNLDEVDNANDWYTEVWETITDQNKTIYSAGVVFSELFMNAFEHGNLSITNKQKHKLLEDDTYFSTLQNRSRECSKKIKVTINSIKYNNKSYIVTKISDEGEGFDTQSLSEIFRNTDKFNGRGVFVSRRSSLGIYYNQKGNSVIFLHKV